MPVIQEGELRFTFPAGAGVLRLDGNSHGLSHCMKAVDFIVEFADFYLFVDRQVFASQLTQPDFPRAIAIDNGFMRLRESEMVAVSLRELGLESQFTVVDASADFLKATKGLVLPEAKRAAVGSEVVGVGGSAPGAGDGD